VDLVLYIRKISCQLVKPADQQQLYKLPTRSQTVARIADRTASQQLATVAK